MRQAYPNEIYGTGNEGAYLQHWKYIKKVKTSSGKWRYIYDESSNKQSANRKDYKRILDSRDVSSKQEFYEKYPDLKQKTGEKMTLESLDRHYAERDKTLGGKTDAFMDKNGEKVATTLNNTSDAIAKAAKNIEESSESLVNKGKSLFNSLLSKLKSK